MNLIKIITGALLMSGLSSCISTPADTRAELSIERRVFKPMLDGKWIGNGISYGAYRDGESPDDGSLTSKENILEDLSLIAKRWNMIRMYGSEPQSENIIQVIRDNNLPIRVMLGAWIDAHWTKEKNETQVREVIRLANKFSNEVIAVNIGNEIFVDWSWHGIKGEAGMDGVIRYIRDVRSKIKQPVTVSDDYNFWNKPHADKIVAEIDFIALHAYAFWNNKTLAESMDWTKAIYSDIQSRYPDVTLALCESGWPTGRIYDDGSHEGGLIGKAGEDEQKIFFELYNHWVDANGINSFYFSAFDENWKGGFDGTNPNDKCEKHWGVYNADRTPKKLLK